MNDHSSNSGSPLPSEWREEWSRELAQPLGDSAAEDSIAMLVFRLDSEWFSLPANVAVEISRTPVIHRLPHRGKAIGVVNVRGRVTACIDLASILGPLEKNTPVGNRLIVWKHHDWLFASRVDEIDGVHKLALRTIDPPPSPANASRFTIGLWSLNGRSVARLDEQRLFTAAREALA